MRTNHRIAFTLAAAALVAGPSPSDAGSLTLGSRRNIIAFDGKVDDLEVVTAALAAMDQGKTVLVFSVRESCDPADDRATNGIDLWNIEAALAMREQAALQHAWPEGDEENAVDVDLWGEYETLGNGKNLPVDEVADQEAARASAVSTGTIAVYPGITQRALEAWSAELKPMLVADEQTVAIFASCSSATYLTSGGGKDKYF